MAGKIGGINNLKNAIDENGNVTVNGYTPETLNELMSGVRYGGIYGFEQPEDPDGMADWPKDEQNHYKPESQANYQTTAENNYNRTNGYMKVDVTKTGATYTVDIYLDSSVTKSYSETGVSLTSLSVLKLQSHWGSGVVFSHLEIVKKTAP